MSCSAFTHLKCHGAGSRPDNVVAVSDKPSIDDFSATFNVIHVVSNISTFKLKHYLELYQLRTC